MQIMDSETLSKRKTTVVASSCRNFQLAQFHNNFSHQAVQRARPEHSGALHEAPPDYSAVPPEETAPFFQIGEPYPRSFGQYMYSERVREHSVYTLKLQYVEYLYRWTLHPTLFLSGGAICSFPLAGTTLYRSSGAASLTCSLG